MKKISILILLAMIALSAGCSSMVYRDSKREIAIERAMMVSTNQESAIRAVQLNGGVGIGVNVLAGEAIMRHPVKQFIAAATDAALIYGAYEGIRQLDLSSSDSDSEVIDISGSNNTIIIQKGDGTKEAVNDLSESHEENN